ncbi:MAG: type 4a pilus biogenesis protein PilO [Gaiellales bacterium]|nr:type 4a pilus biogenesis protein PilO [Gaiellales bacterium]
MSRRNIYIVSGIALVAIVVAYWFLLFSPLQDRISQHDRQIEDERQRLTVLQTKLTQFATLKDEAARNKGRLLELAKLVPESEELPSLLLEVQELATEAGITFVSVTPSAASMSEGFQVIPLELQFVGSFFDVNDFIYRAEQLASGPGRLLSVQALTLSVSSDTSGQSAAGLSPKLSVSMTLNAYERNPSLESPPQAQAQATPAAASE